MIHRYLVSKGWEGFCDRLQCLSHCVTWALRYNRILYVDWRDRIWSHDTGDFYQYFNLVDLPFIDSPDAIPTTRDVCPSFWYGGPGLVADGWMYRVKDQLIIDPQEGRHFEKVWIHPGIGFRAYDFAVLPNHLRFTDEVASEVKRLLDSVDDSLPVVHLRGTDRAIDEARWDVLRNAAPVANVVSDDKVLASRWMNESPKSRLVSDTLVEGVTGGHKLTKKDLKTIGYDKRTMNLRLLADFVLLAKAGSAHALNEQSVFFTMSRLFGKCGGVAALFSGSPGEQKQDGYSLRLSIR